MWIVHVAFQLSTRNRQNRINITTRLLKNNNLNTTNNFFDRHHNNKTKRNNNAAEDKDIVGSVWQVIAALTNLRPGSDENGLNVSLQLLLPGQVAGMAQ
jgi:hypothetical protein